ncbi:LysR family transcriptional regulator [Altererythrobacter sp. MF3-039]|uniref:LysR family transcriptional regulator n=1 Tax=Altererythrobacter sp. MF3-039 TaxID=3252901 RepID=UPI00390C834D
MAEMEITLRQLTYLTRLQEKASFTAAAETLGITQPALSIAISQLEEALGVSLVERGTRPVTFTDFGELMLTTAHRVLREIKQVREEITALESGKVGRLDICMAPSAVGLAVSEVLSEMVEEFPELEIHIGRAVLPAVAERLHSGEFSAFIGTINESDKEPTLDIIPLTSVQLIVVAGGGHALAGRDEVAMHDLTEHQWIQIGNIDANLPAWRKAFQEAGLVPPVPALDIRNIGLVRDMLMQDQFVTVLPAPMVARDISAGLLADVSPAGLDWRLPLRAVTSRVKRPSSGVRLFLEKLEAKMAAPTY